MVFAADLVKDQVVVVSGGAGGIGARSPGCLRGLAPMSPGLGTVYNRRNADGGRWRSALGRDLDHGEAILFHSEDT